MNIGDTLYRFDVNRRVYREPGRIGGGAPIYREHFAPRKIVGENRVSWLMEGGWKVNKKTLKGDAGSYQYGGRGFFTAEEMEEDIWDHTHRHKISDAVQRKVSVTDLKKIAQLIGYAATDD